MRPRLSLGLQIFVAYAVFVAMAGWFVLRTIADEIKPGVRQSTEETLVDTANLLAEILREDVRNGTLNRGALAAALSAYGKRRPDAQIWGIAKTAVNHRIYVTDGRGIVLADSTGAAVGQDYSQWNDVYLTLRGRYGARSTQEVPGDELSTVMHVAAPIVDGGRIIGVVTVAKPNRTLQPYIDRTERRLGLLGGGLILLGLALGALFAWWVSRATRSLTAYAERVSRGERAQAPDISTGEFGRLAGALETMRTELEGKAYVERYVQTLTHELKSPIAAIRAASELLRDDMTPEQRRRFLANIDDESARTQQLVDRLLDLAQLEQRRGLVEFVAVPLHDVIEAVLQGEAGRIAKAAVHVSVDVPQGIVLRGERFLLRQALTNLLDNALDFTPVGGSISVGAIAAGPLVDIRVRNSGEPIPGFALPRVTERFYSLPRPSTGRKSTGLGLSFVVEIAALHDGQFEIRNVDGGVEARLALPAA